MPDNSGASLLDSRSVAIAAFDAILTTILFLVTRYAPDSVDMAKFLIVTWQPIAIALIAKFTAENISAQHAGAKLEIARLNCEAQGK